MGRISWVLAIALAFLIFPPACSYAAEPAAREWLRGSMDALEIRLHGEIVEQDGSPARDASVSCRLVGHRVKSTFDASVAGSKFEAWLPVNQVQPYWVTFTATSPDGAKRALLRLNAYQLRQAAIDGARLELATPSRHIYVKVEAEREPVAGATVKAEMELGDSVTATTNDAGIAELALLKEQKLSGLMAWTDERVGGYSFYRKPARDPEDFKHVIELNVCRQQKLRFIDESGAPVAGLSCVMQIATPDDYNYVGVNEQSRMTTDDSGEAVHRQFPDWEKVHCYVDLEGHEWVGGSDPKLVDGVYLFEVSRARERRRVEMALDGDELAGLFVSVDSFQGERDSHSDVLSAWTDEQGRYAVDVLPDATYCAHVLDAYWVSPMVAVVPYDSALKGNASAELAVSEGEAVEVFVSKGADKKPFPNLFVRFSRELDYSWREDGDTRYGQGSADWYASTDHAGRVVTRTAIGPVKVSVFTPVWRTEEEIDVVAGQPAKVQLHCAVDEKRRYKGRIVADADLAFDANAMEVKWGAVDGKFDEEGSVECDDKGRFEFEAAATEVGVYAMASDGEAAGFAVVKDQESPLEVQLTPTASYDGQLLDADGKPLAGRGIRALVRVEGDEDFNGLFIKAFDAVRLETTTDVDGNFTLERLPIGLKASLSAAASDGSDDTEYLEAVLLEAGEQRPRHVHRLDEPVKVVEKSLAKRFAQARRDCELMGYRLMVLCSWGSASGMELVDRRFVEHDENRNVSRFMQVVIHGSEGKLSDEALAFLTAHGWDVPEPDGIAAWALDERGKELGRLELAINDPEAAEKSVAFINEHAPPPVDAQKKWDEAFGEAKRSGRRVWARVSGRYCGPCFRMARWLDDERELVAKDYVLLKIDQGDLHGADVAQRLTRGRHHGIPYHCIFDAEGVLLVDSAGPLGNVGHPTGFDGQKQLRKMLMETRLKLTDDEVDQLVKSVGE